MQSSHLDIPKYDNGPFQKIEGKLFLFFLKIQQVKG